MQHQAQEIELLELAEGVEDAMKQAHELVSKLSLYALERRAIRQLERNGFGSFRAERTLVELVQERKRLAAVNDEPGAV